jgi:plasmid stabilization system protein ParE
LAEVLVRALARRDILSSADYLDEHGSAETAQRFLDATQSTFEALAKMPKLGSLCAFSKPALRRIRRWPVRGFENWLVFLSGKAQWS